MADGGDAVVRGVRLAVDVGTVRVGVASSDPDGLLATPVETVARASGKPRPGAADVARIAHEARERGADVVYVGLPRHLSGAEGSSAGLARAYAVALARAVGPVQVRLVDERMSTVSAHHALQASGRSGRRHRQVVDQAAAVVILQQALDAERSTGRRPGERVEVDPGRDAAAPGGGAGDGTTTVE
ncbi:MULTISPECIES: Holliday junction resolvase RuvX [Cellulomonas]|uniref:Putative pre-16S rRNA nuclease n=1 Tax=Cellulomonas iranensis TaxID=76862 RepID=A0ABU0GP54_9CELL|nr:MULTISPECIES: Holliday junction resolvase RuvX [Cellulomonas]MDQ0427078.1 putative Holliday junction resolvase [Cellulomonas iranensis]UCN13108.1 Holliday junction resolvase RuvX [Cellulomonas iranensis]